MVKFLSLLKRYDKFLICLSFAKDEGCFAIAIVWFSYLSLLIFFVVVVSVLKK